MPVEKVGNFIRARINDPSKYVSFRYGTLSEEQGIYVVYGKARSDGGKEKWEIQAFRFSVKKGWTVEKAKMWLKDHGYTAKSVEFEKGD